MRKALEWAFEQGIRYFYWGTRRTPGMRDAIRNLAPRHRDSLIIALQSYDTTGLITAFTFKRGLRQLGIEYADVLILGKRDAPLSRRVVDSALALRACGSRSPPLRERARPFDVRAAPRARNLRSSHGALQLRAYRRGARGLPASGRSGRSPRSPVLQHHALGPFVRCRLDAAGRGYADPNHLYRFVLSHPVVDLVLTAPKNREQLESNLMTLQQGPPDSDERAWLQRVGTFVRGLSPQVIGTFSYKTCVHQGSGAAEE